MKRTAVFSTFILFIIIIFSGCKNPPIPSVLNVYFVSVSGDDSNSGSLQSPWRNPGYASRRLKPGDTLIILGGIYLLSEYDEDILIPPSGEKDNWITIRGENGNRPVLAGSNNLFSAIILSDVRYIRIENIEITSFEGGFFRDAINATSEKIENIEIRDMYVHHIDEFGLNIKDVFGIVIDGCTFSHCGFGAIGGPAGEEGGWENAVISNCNLTASGHYYHGIEDNPENPYDRADGIGIEGSLGPLEINNCVSSHNRGDGIDTKNENVYIHECVVSNNYGDGIKLWGDGSRVENTLVTGTGDGDTSSPWCPVVIDNIGKSGSKFTLSNLTIHDNPLRTSYSIYVQYSSTVPVDVSMTNCIFSDCYGMAFFGDSVSLTANNNCFNRPGEDEQVHANSIDYTAAQINSGLLGNGNISADPDFINPSWGGEIYDYHLDGDSPCIDSGTATNAPGSDIEGTFRPKGSGYDMGVYENGKAEAEYVRVENTVQLVQAVENANNGGLANIRIDDGTYTLSSQLWIGRQGTDIRGLSGNAENVIIQGQGMHGSVPMIFEVAAEDFHLEGVTLKNVANHAVQVHGELGAHNPRFKNVIFQDTYEQMLKVSYNLSVSAQKLSGGMVENCVFEYTSGIGPQYYIGGIDVHNGKDWIIRDSVFKNIRSPSGSLAEHAIHFWSDSEGTLVERNLIINCDRGIGFGLGDRGHSGGIIRNNMIYHDTSEGFADVGISLENAKDARVYNNTVFMENSYPNAIEYRFPGTSDVYIANNLTNKAILSRDGGSGLLQGNFTNATGNLFSDDFPGDLHLKTHTTGVSDSGVLIPQLTDDFDGDARPMGIGIDIGADEFD